MCAMSDEPSTRREFLGCVARISGATAIGVAAVGLTVRADADKVWTIDIRTCDGCEKFNASADGLSRCATECVLKKSAVKVVNKFDECGYCRICPGYHDVNSEVDEEGLPAGRVCPYDAIARRQVGLADPALKKNWFYEYTIDESKCTGCGKCIIGCAPEMGNGSLKLQVRHNLCVDCNECAIATACPTDAFVRAPIDAKRPGR
ncbi:MAG: hypothetical protein BIFFINMI_00083 [Phycisphaerae bacterium]|nr:hypothetical protein [Phycisphaerae bacterium]